MTKKTDNFESKMNRLKDIVGQLEKEDIDLDKSIELYEEGLKLSKILKNELSIFEGKINELNEDTDE